jgi:PKD repeat protein
MKNIMNNIFVSRLLLFVSIALLMIKCTPEVEEGSPPDAPDFTFLANPANLLEVTFTKTTEDASHYAWNFGDGTPLSFEANPVHIYESPGTYNVILNARTHGGSKLKSAQVVVLGNEPPNLIAGGDLSDQSLWTVASAGMTLSTTSFANGELKFSNGAGPAQTNVLAYTTAQVEAGKTYKFSAKVKGSGASNSWFELYLGTTAPVAGSDYSEGLYLGLNTWDGCGTSAFNGNLATLSCKANASGNGKEGLLTFNNSGTIYLVFKAGSWDGSLGTDGITLDDVKLIEVDQVNLITAGDMTDADAWTSASAGMTLTTTEFVNETLKFSNGAGPIQSNVLVYQAVEVEAGKEYKFSAKVKGSGASNTWFEVYFGKTVPTAGSDYSDGLYTGLNTWDGCATSAFDGNLATLGCKANAAGLGKNGIITFAESGTIYVVFKAGSWDGSLGTDGILLDNVALVEVQ